MQSEGKEKEAMSKLIKHQTEDNTPGTLYTLHLMKCLTLFLSQYTASKASDLGACSRFGELLN